MDRIKERLKQGLAFGILMFFTLLDPQNHAGAAPPQDAVNSTSPHPLDGVWVMTDPKCSTCTKKVLISTPLRFYAMTSMYGASFFDAAINGTSLMDLYKLDSKPNAQPEYRLALLSNGKIEVTGKSDKTGSKIFSRVDDQSLIVKTLSERASAKLKSFTLHPGIRQTSITVFGGYDLINESAATSAVADIIRLFYFSELRTSAFYINDGDNKENFIQYLTDGNGNITRVYNHALINKNQENAAKAQADLQQRQAEERRRPLIAFVRKSDVTASTTLASLNANVFLFQDNTVAVPATFVKMIQRTDALFESYDASAGPALALVSGVPSARFVAREEVLLAVRVVGNTTVKTPAGGELQIPHLQYVDSVAGQHHKGDVDAAMQAH